MHLGSGQAKCTTCYSNEASEFCSVAHGQICHGQCGGSNLLLCISRGWWDIHEGWFEMQILRVCAWSYTCVCCHCKVMCSNNRSIDEHMVCESVIGVGTLELTVGLVIITICRYNCTYSYLTGLAHAKVTGSMVQPQLWPYDGIYNTAVQHTIFIWMEVRIVF